MQHYDVVVIGGGMAGASIAFELAADRRVALLDMEDTLAFHTTGRSAAMFLESYGGTAVRALTIASREFLDRVGVLTPLPIMYVGRTAALDELYATTSPLVPTMQVLDAAASCELQPLLRPGSTPRAVLEPDATEIDVHALHQHYVRGLRERGGAVHVRARVTAAEHVAGAWQLDTAADRVTAPVVVNAAGAWADPTAELFGAGPLGLQPLRRTVFIADAPPGVAPPMIADIDDAYYVKPERGRLLCSPADETPQPPSDARADELEIARAIDAINEVTTLDIRHVRSRWAGLRTFAPDRSPVVGYDPDRPGLFWFAGQGGYGIQMAAALARTGAALVREEGVPDDVAALGLSAAAIAPQRLL